MHPGIVAGARGTEKAEGSARARIELKTGISQLDECRSLAYKSTSNFVTPLQLLGPLGSDWPRTLDELDPKTEMTAPKSKSAVGDQMETASSSKLQLP
jgi:hypothetical protein